MACNTSAPVVSQIPHEILADIFLLNTSRDIEFWDASKWVLVTDHDPQQTARYSSQVCQKWRYVALGYAKLWSRIILYGKEPLPWIDELLRRSYPRTIEFGRAPSLATWLGRLDRPRLPVLTRVMCHAQRLKTVNVALTGQEAWQKVCEGLLQNQAPNLEYLNIFAQNYFVFTGTLFSDNAPSLRRLHLSQCLVNLCSSTLSNLTELSVVFVFSGAPTVDVWLSNLENMPSLRWLTIINAISGPFLTDPEPLPTPSLPNLSCLSVKGKLLECVRLVYHIRHPPLDMLRLRCVDVTPGLELDQLASIIKKSLDLWPTPATADRNFVFKTEDARIEIGNSCTIGSQWNVSESQGDIETLENPLLSIELSVVGLGQVQLSAFPLLLLFADIFTTVRSLTFSPDFEMEHVLDLFFEALLLFDNVEEMELIYDPHKVFLPILQTQPQIVEDRTTVLLPSLRRLSLSDVGFDRDGEAFDILVSYLQYREQMLAPIKDLEFVRTPVSLAQRSVLEQFSGLSARQYNGRSNE
jgi:hypothetical protein